MSRGTGARWRRLLQHRHRPLAAATVLTLVAAITVAVPVPSASAATPPISVMKSGPTSTLEGAAVRYTLAATNPTAGAGGVTQYNASFRDVLPAGVNYVAGSTEPADIGDPTVVTDPVSGAQTLIWQNAFDLPPGGADSLSFEVSADPLLWPVQSTFTDTATGYSSTSPRVVPQFGPTGAPIALPSVTASPPTSASTQVSALTVTKDEPSPEGKLLRGAHDQTTVYTLTVANGDGASTSNVVVNDYLPASLEFLGCGGVDNSTTGVEYPGAPSLAATPPVGADCLTAAAVDTVNTPAGLPSGVYTQVTWNLGTLAPGQVVTIKYAAGIPLQQNTLTFPGGQPSPQSLDQAANLDNNTGPTTRQNGPAVALTNHVAVTGTYAGPIAPGSSPAVNVETSHTVTANDLRIVKSVTPTDFSGGNLATYTLQINSSEYVDNSAISVTDTIPNGICPLSTTQNYVAGAPSDCAPGTVAPSVPYQSVTQNPDGTFTVVFDPIAVAHNGSATITYQVRMRTTYTGGPLAGSPTATGDVFTNNATENGTSTARPITGETGNAPVTDSSSVSQTSSGGSVTKSIQPRVANQNCADNTYAQANLLSSAQTTFQKGDRICFEITIAFPQQNDTLNPIVADFLPLPTDYESGSYVVGPDNTVPADQIDFDETGAASGALTWTLGATQPDGARAVDAGAIFQARFSVIVTDAAPGTNPLASSNITKVRGENSSGGIRALRAIVPFAVEPAPPLSITKGVKSVNGVPAAGNPPNVDHVQVQEGDHVVFRVDVTNAPTATTAVHSVTTWDVLPAGITCADVSNIDSGGVCTDPLQAGHPPFASAATLSAIAWTRPATEVINPGSSVTYTYAVTIPPGTGVGTDLVDTASVRSFETDTNVAGRTTTYFPMNNVDTTVDPADQDAPPASDNSDVFIAAVVVGKTVLSAINEAGNAGGETPPGGPSTQATVGEQVTYTVTADVPPNATVYAGVLNDPMPTGLTLLSATAGFSPSAGTVPPTNPLPPGVMFDAATATMTLPPVLDNTSAVAVRFAVTIVARVTTATSNVAAVTRTNTATFTSGASPEGAAPQPQTGSSNVVIVEPAPALRKTANPTSVTGSQTVTYTLTASNAAGASVLHDAWVVDCVPVGISFSAYGTPTQGTTIAATPGAGAPCASGTTQLEWNVGDVAPGAAPKLTYTAVVNPAATGLQSFKNTATLTGDSLAGARTGPTDPGATNGRLYTTTTTSTVTVLGAALVKTASPNRATIGQTVTYTLTGTLNANVTYFNASGIDTLPAGLDPASVQLISVTCIAQGGGTCVPTSASPLQPVVNANGTTTIGLYFGDVGVSAVPRQITVVYSANVADVPLAKAGVTLTNNAHIAWNNTSKTPPTLANAAFDKMSSSASAPLTVIEPSMSITKSVDDTTVEPGQVFHYTLQALNSSAPNASAAYNAMVTDAVPTGVVVDPTSISDGGTLTGAAVGTGAGGTITWTLPGPIAVGASVPLSYAATLAPSLGLTTAPQVNRAVVAGYDSLPAGGRHYPATTPATAPVTPTFPSVQATKTTAQGTTAFVGEPFGWQISVVNSGQGSAYNVGAIDTLPPNWTYDDNSAQVSINGGAPTQVDPTVTGSGSILTWSGLATLAPHATVTITYTATPTPGVAGNPGVGLSVNQNNTATPVAQDQTGATRNATGSYAGPASTATAHIASADLALTKQVGTQPTAGQNGSWQLTVVNHGPDTAVGPFTVTDGFNDPLPVGISNVTAAGPGWSCTTAAPITCTRTNAADTLANAAQFPPITVSYSVDPDVDDGTVLSNAATISARTFDPNLDNNTGEADTTVETRADLAISKTLTSPQLVAGDPATYAIAVTNLGPSVSAGPFTITDTLPPTSTFDSATGAGWACQPIAPGTVGATLTCTHSVSLGVGSSTEQLVVTVGIPGSQTADVVNTATITDTTTPDPNPANDTATVTTTPATSADLKIQKAHVGTFVAGDDAQYALQVENNGPSDAADATITDTLATGVTLLPSNNADWTCSAVGQAVTCAHPAPLPNQSTSTLTLNVHLDPGLDTNLPILNSASVASSTPDPDLTNNTDGDDTLVNRSADLSIQKHHIGDAVAGSPLTYTLSVANNGPSTIAGPVTVTDPLPAGLTYDAANPAGGSGWTCTYANDTRLVTCVLAAGLAAHADAPDISLNVIVDSDAGPSTIVNTANVNSTVDDPDLTNNHAEDPTTVGVDANVALTKTLQTPTPVLAGTTATFTLQATNTGPSDAADIIVADPLPDHLTYVAATGDGWTCSLLGNTVLCARATLPAVPPGSPVAPITLVTTIDPSTPLDANGTATLVNTAQITTSSPGAVTNPDPVPVPVAARADLTLTKSPSTNTPTAGTSFTWTMLAHNTGPSDTSGPLTLTDTLPAFESFLSASAPWTCVAGPAPATPTDQQSVTCTLSDGLPVGADAPALQLLVLLDADAPDGVQTNTATVTSPTPGDPGTGTGTVTVSRTAQLSITKTHTGNGIVGQPIDFQLGVHNSGPSEADQLVVTDPLPTGLTYVAATGTGWTCAASGQNVLCQFAGSLAVGADAPPITLTVRVGPAAYDRVVNVATVASTDPDLPGSASASDELTVDPDAALELIKQHTNQFIVGGQGDYLITVTNAGPTATPGPIVISDPLPNGLTFVAASGTGWSCALSGFQVVCSRSGPLAVGASSTVSLAVAIDLAAAPAVINTATATAPGGPPASGSDTAPVAVPPIVSSPGGDLAATGMNVFQLSMIALALMILGALALASARRRRAVGGPRRG